MKHRVNHDDDLDHHEDDADDNNDLTSRDLTVLDLSFESSLSTSCSGRPVGIVASTWWSVVIRALIVMAKTMVKCSKCISK